MRRALVALALALPLSASAQEDEPRAVYRAVTTLNEDDFRELPVSADLVRPGGVYISHRDSARFPPMFLLRVSFNDEMGASVDLVK